jgi:crotonobetainyl-CoA:carnitine CoA-transferase CaiB-like acyl-CoA transferase
MAHADHDRANAMRQPGCSAGFTVTRDKAELYEAGQRHGVSLAPVAIPADLLESPQLAARGFFRDVEVAGRRMTVPGPPYRFAGLDVGPRSSPR